MAARYGALEGALRRVIDALGGTVCAPCPSPCCRVHYCRQTALNPWYRLVSRVAVGFRLPPDWEIRRDPFGLGPGGCEIRGGRYLFCYSYNCRRLLAALPGEEARQTWQEWSDLLLPVNRLPGGQFLHELRDPGALRSRDLSWMGARLDEAGERMKGLAGRLARWVAPVPSRCGPHAEGRLDP